MFDKKTITEINEPPIFCEGDSESIVDKKIILILLLKSFEIKYPGNHEPLSEKDRGFAFEEIIKQYREALCQAKSP